MRIIAVEDEKLALGLLVDGLEEAVPEAEIVAFLNAEEALSYAAREPVDVAFLDIVLGHADGIALAKELLAIKEDTNIIFVTAHGEFMNEAFALYASGYVHKPVRVSRLRRELNNLRHPLPEDQDQNMVQILGSFTIDHLLKRVYQNGLDLLLTPREFSIFYLLSSRPGEFFTAKELNAKTAGYDSDQEPAAIYSHISRLKKKLEDAAKEAEYEIVQSRGKGYRLVRRN